MILIELKGGNDGLNTLVPYKDPLYKKLRPKLHIKEGKFRSIDDGLGIGLNSELKFFGADNKLRSDVAILHSVGYPNVNKSHFKESHIGKTPHLISQKKVGLLEHSMTQIMKSQNEIPALKVW